MNSTKRGRDYLREHVRSKGPVGEGDVDEIIDDVEELLGVIRSLRASMRCVLGDMLLCGRPGSCVRERVRADWCSYCAKHVDTAKYETREQTSGAPPTTTIKHQ